MKLGLMGKAFPLREPPSHARPSSTVGTGKRALFSHCFFGLQILHLSSPHEQQGMPLAKPPWTNWKTSTQKVAQKES